MYGKLLTAGVCILSVLVGQGPAEAPLADRLPARTLFYVASAGDNEAMGASHLGRFLRSPGMQRAIEQFKKGVIAESGGRVEMVSLMEMLHQGAKGKACFALVDLIDPENPRGSDPAFVLIAELGDNEKAFVKALDALMATAPPDIRQKKAIGQARLHEIGASRQDDERVVLGVHEKTFYFIFGQKLPEQILGVSEMESLADSPRFKQQFAQVDGKNLQLAVYLQVDRLIEEGLKANATPSRWIVRQRTQDELEEYKNRRQAENRQIRSFLDGLGIGKATGLAGAARVTDDGRMHTKIKLFSPTPHNGLLMIADGKPVTEADLAAVPSDAIYAAVSNVPARRVLLEAARIFQSLPEGQAPNLDAVVRKIEQATGINLVTDVFDQLGDVSTLMMTRSGGGLVASTVFSIELKDAAKVQAALDKVRKILQDAAPQGNPRRRRPMAAPSIESIHLGRQRIDYLAVPLRRDPFPVAPAWMIRGKTLYVAAFPQVLEEIVSAPAGGSGLTDREDFTKALARLGGRPSVVAFCDADELVRQLYPFAAMGWTTLANLLHAEEGLAFKPAMLPPLTEITRMLTPGITTLRGEDDGVVIEQIGSFPTLGLPAGPAYVPLGLGAGVPLMQIARLDAKKTLVLTHLRMIAQGCLIYVNENNGALPSSIEQLVKNQYIDARVLRSPFNSAPPPRLQNGKLIGESDYQLVVKSVRHLTLRRLADFPLVVEKLDEYDPRRGTGIAFADGHAEWFTGDKEQLRERIASAIAGGK